MLHHRVAFEEHKPESRTSEFAYSVEQVPRIEPRIVAATLLCLDLAVCAAICFTMRGGSGVVNGHTQVLVSLAVSIAFWLASAYATALYDQAALRSGGIQVLPALATTCLVFAPSLPIAEIGGMPSPTALHAFLCQLLAVAALRLGWGVAMRVLLRRGYCLERVLLLASSISASRLICANLERRTRGRLRVTVSAAAPQASDPAALLWLERLARNQRVDRILLADTASTSDRADDAIISLARAGTNITVLSHGGTTLSVHPKPSTLPRLDDDAPPLSPGQLACKRAFDIAFGAVAIFGLSPWLLLIAAIVRLDSKGPALFKQTRQGLNGQPFTIMKFRTMYTDLADVDCSRQTSRGDARVTRIGRFLRASSLDELPQLLNVLRGDMSVIGPRPHALGMTVGGRPVASAVSGYTARLRVKPGITGWAQLNGSRGEVNVAKALRQRVALDCHYIENWSLKRDAMILWRTVALVFHDGFAF